MIMDDIAAGLIESVTDARKRHKQAADKADSALSLYHATIRVALVAGVKVPDLMKATGYSRRRIYQIRDRTR